MARTYLKRRKSAPPEEAVTPRGIQRQLAWAAGSGYFQHRDPLWHVTESFQTTFDRIGRQKTGESAENEHQPQEQSGKAAPDGETRQDRRADGRPSLREFSQTAFQRGNLAGAVLQGTGRMMLTSCLKRTVGQSGQTARQRTLMGLGAKTKNVPGAAASQVMFHRGFVNSAVGLVVDVLQDARRTVDLMARMVQGGGGVGEHEGMDTLRTMYPFLDQSREEQLLEQYRRQLGQAAGVQEKALLQSAILRTEALMDKKAQMKAEFTQKLREVSDRANDALREFQEPDFVDSLMQDLTEGGVDASDGQSMDGGSGQGEPPDSGTGANPPERSEDIRDGDAGGAGGDEAGQAPAGADPADRR